jgi:hypothetical protein
MERRGKKHRMLMEVGSDRLEDGENDERMTLRLI